MNRRQFLTSMGSLAAVMAAERAFGYCFWERKRLPKGVEPRPFLAWQFALDDPRRRQNQFLPKPVADGREFRFGSDGTFTFFHLSDLHEERPKTGERERALFAKLCDRFQPSLAIVTGDNSDLRCRGLFEESAGAVVDLFAHEKVPFAVTFGNHDTEIIGEGWYGASEQWDFYRRAAGGLFVDRHDPSVIGGGSSRITVRDAAGAAKFDLCVLDSGDYCRQPGPLPKEPLGLNEWSKGCGSVSAPQVAWAEKTLGQGVPSLFFQHIIVPEIRASIANSRFWFKHGYLCEGVGAVPTEFSRDPAFLSDGKSIYDVWRAAPNFRGAYFGHDHANTFDGVTEHKVRLGMTKTLSQCAYNDGDLGLRVFRLHADGTFETDLHTEKHPDGVNHDRKKKA